MSRSIRIQDIYWNFSIDARIKNSFILVKGVTSLSWTEKILSRSSYFHSLNQFSSFRVLITEMIIAQESKIKKVIVQIFQNSIEKKLGKA